MSVEEKKCFASANNMTKVLYNKKRCDYQTPTDYEQEKRIL